MKTFNQVFTNYNDFKIKVVNVLNTLYPGAEWLNENKSYTKFNTLYQLLVFKYGDRNIRYDDELMFINKLIYSLVDILPNLYAKQQVFINNQLSTFLSDDDKRGIIVKSDNNDNRNSNSNSKNGISSSPLDIVITNASEIANAAITSANLNNVELVEIHNGTAKQISNNYISDIQRALKGEYDIQINNLLNDLKIHFTNIVGEYRWKNECGVNSIKNKKCEFNNGYIVNEVDYLGTENREAINATNNKLSNLNDSILILDGKVSSKQNKLTAGANIDITNDVISASFNGVSIDDLINLLKPLKDRVVVTANDTILWSPDKQKALYVNNNNAYKSVGYGDEVLASEDWARSRFQRKLKAVTPLEIDNDNNIRINQTVLNEWNNLKNLIDRVNDLAQENAVKIADLENDKTALEQQVKDLENSIHLLQIRIIELETFKTSAQNSITVLEQFKATEAPYLTTLKTKIKWDGTNTWIVAPNGGTILGVKNDNAFKRIGANGTVENLLSETFADKIYYRKNYVDNIKNKVDENRDLINDISGKLTGLETFKTETNTYLTTLKTKIKWDDDKTYILAPNGSHWIGVKNSQALKNIGYGDEWLASEQWANKQFASKTATTNSINELTTFKTETNTYLTTLKTKIKWNDNTTYLQAPNNQSWIGIKNDAAYISINNGADEKIVTTTTNINIQTLANKVDENRDFINDLNGKVPQLEQFKASVESRLIINANGTQLLNADGSYKIWLQPRGAFIEPRGQSAKEIATK